MVSRREVELIGASLSSAMTVAPAVQSMAVGGTARARSAANCTPTARPGMVSVT